MGSRVHLKLERTTTSVLSSSGGGHHPIAAHAVMKRDSPSQAKDETQCKSQHPDVDHNRAGGVLLLPHDLHPRARAKR
jgi:hypothetical protein